MEIADSKMRFWDILGQHKSAIIGVAVSSVAVNILMLTGSLFMLQVYDRVIPSGSVPTLVGLCLIVVFLYLIQGIFDILRLRILGRIGLSLDAKLGRAIFDYVASPDKALTRGAAFQAQQDLDKVRGFLGSIGPTAIFDAPWLPFYMGLCFVFHPMIGFYASVGALVLCALAMFTEILSRKLVVRSAAAQHQRDEITDAGFSSAQAISVMGMRPQIGQIWADKNASFVAAQLRLNDLVGLMGSASKIFRMILQSGILAVGAWLVIHQQATAGIMIASSIMMSRALAPVETAIGHWKHFVAARQGWARLIDLFEDHGAEIGAPTQLPAPNSSLTLEHVVAGPPESKKPNLAKINFSLLSGQGLGIVGPSGSGKSSLAKVIVGAWPLLAGAVRLDGAALVQWSSEALGQHIGYLPQSVDLLAGTVAQNIARFQPHADASDIIKVAQLADIHEMILRLPDGYETQLGSGGHQLSAGQKQRVALARALYKDPFLVVLDEPNSNLDGEGELALNKAIASVKARGGIVIVVAHRPAILSHLDQVMVMRAGQIEKFGPREEILTGLAPKRGRQVMPFTR